MGASAAEEVNRVQPGKALEFEHQSATKLKTMGVKVVTDLDKSGFVKIAEPYSRHCRRTRPARD